MYLNPTTLLIITACLAGILLAILLAALSSLRKERAKNILLQARMEPLAEEIHSLEQTCERLRLERNQLQEGTRELAVRLAASQTAMAEKEREIKARNDLLTQTREAMEKDFQILAQRIFTEKGAQLSNSHQTELNTLLNPVREQIAAFRKKVEEVYDLESRDRVSLVKEIEHLKELNQQVSEDANHLASALKGQSKLQGLWGEMILEQLLENAGLVRGREFETQASFKDGRGNTRLPDALIHLPGDKNIVIDAKVSLKAYEKACRADDADVASRYLQDHLDSVRKHITGLAAKEYHLLDSLNSPDFVLLFLPTEGAFQAAVSRDPDILTWAAKKKVVLASPSTLLAILRTINHMWRQEEQSRNSLAIAKQAGSLYDKFVGFVEAFEEIGIRLRQSSDAWNTARNRLVTGRGNLVSRAENLRQLGVQSSKNLPDSVSSGPEDEDRDGDENQMHGKEGTNPQLRRFP